MRNELLSTIQDALAIVRHAHLKMCMDKLANEVRSYLVAEADARRAKSKALILSINRLDMEILAYERIVSNMSDMFTAEEEKVFRRVLKLAQQHRESLVAEKKRLACRRR